MVVGATWAKIWAHFFCALFSRFLFVRKIMSIVFNFLPSSPNFDYEDSDSERDLKNFLVKSSSGVKVSPMVMKF